jgi:hypothetical protein
MVFSFAGKLTQSDIFIIFTAGIRSQTIDLVKFIPVNPKGSIQ